MVHAPWQAGINRNHCQFLYRCFSFFLFLFLYYCKEHSNLGKKNIKSVIKLPISSLFSYSQHSACFEMEELKIIGTYITCLFILIFFQKQKTQINSKNIINTNNFIVFVASLIFTPCIIIKFQLSPSLINKLLFYYIK